MEPKPLVGLNHLDVPVAILRLRKRAFPGGRPCRIARQPIWTSSFRRRSKTRVWTPREIRTAPMLSPDYPQRSTVKRIWNDGLTVNLGSLRTRPWRRRLDESGPHAQHYSPASGHF